MIDLFEKIKQIQILRPQSGDILFVNVNKESTKDEVYQWSQKLESIFKKKGIKDISIIMSNANLELKIIRKE